MSEIEDFENAIKRLDKDLQELEDISNHLNEVKGFANRTKELGEKFDAHLETSAELFKSSTNKLESFIEDNGEHITQLVESHKELSGRVKDMEDKVTVLNTKTESIAKELSQTIKQLEKDLVRINNENFEKAKKLLQKQAESIETTRTRIIYLLIPILLILCFLLINTFANIV